MGRPTHGRDGGDGRGHDGGYGGHDHRDHRHDGRGHDGAADDDRGADDRRADDRRVDHRWPTTSGIDVECMARLQDCPEGLKCTAYAKVLQDTWDANKCVPETGDGVAGDPCEIERTPLRSAASTTARRATSASTPTARARTGSASSSARRTTAARTRPAAPASATSPHQRRPAPDLPRHLRSARAGLPGHAGLLRRLMRVRPSSASSLTRRDGGMDNTTCEFTNACLPGLHCHRRRDARRLPAGLDRLLHAVLSARRRRVHDPEECVAFFPSRSRASRTSASACCPAELRRARAAHAGPRRPPRTGE
jgi:hypothetical protein